jgi:hypothetical protein
MAYLLNSIPLLEMMFAEIQYSFRTGQSATVDCSNHVLPRVCFENLTVPIQHQLHNNLFSAQTLSIMMQRRVSWLFSSPVILLVEKKKVFQMLLRSRVAAAPLGERKTCIASFLATFRTNKKSSI